MDKQEIASKIDELLVKASIIKNLPWYRRIWMREGKMLLLNELEFWKDMWIIHN